MLIPFALVTMAWIQAAPVPGATSPQPGFRVDLDAHLAEQALAFLATGNQALLADMAATPAAAHLLRHARTYAYDFPRDSTAALTLALVSPEALKRERVAAAGKALAYFNGPMRADTSWLADVSRGLPADAPCKASLFLTFGYDIGVSCPGTASLNAAHRHFEAHPRELLYYAIHELHHTGFMTYQQPRPVAEWRTAADLLAQAEYALQLEGMAVWAVWERRRAEGAMDWDEDYVALQDEGRLRTLEAAFRKAHAALEVKAQTPGPADPAARALLSELYGSDRIFYRFGAFAARQIELRQGRPALIALVKAGPHAFLQAYLQGQHTSQTTAAPAV